MSTARTNREAADIQDREVAAESMTQKAAKPKSASRRVGKPDGERAGSTRGRKRAQPSAPDPVDAEQGELREQTVLQDGAVVDTEQWHRRVAEAAYYRAERRGFMNGSPEQDWLEAEEELRRSKPASASPSS